MIGDTLVQDQSADQQRIIHHELHKMKKMPPWGKRQGNRWDRLSNFIYHTPTLQEVWHQVNEVGLAERLDIEAFGAYTIRRWYNHHTHDQILRLFYAHPDVQQEEDQKHHSIDFYLREIPFDLKISRFPHAYPHSLDHAQHHPRHLVHWLYANQSKEGRYHTGNRLFLILHHNQPGQVWELRRNFAALNQHIRQFLDRPTLLGLTLQNEKTGQVDKAWTGIIFYTV